MFLQLPLAGRFVLKMQPVTSQRAKRMRRQLHLFLAVALAYVQDIAPQ